MNTSFAIKIYSYRAQMITFVLILLLLTIISCAQEAHDPTQDARAAYRQGDYQQALLKLGEVINLNPQSVEPYLLKGLINEEAGNFSNAESAYQVAANINVVDKRPNLYLGWLLFRQRRFSDAYDYLRKAENSGGEPEVVVPLISSCLFFQGKGGEAYDHFERAVSGYPDNTALNDRYLKWKSIIHDTARELGLVESSDQAKDYLENKFSFLAPSKY